MISRIEIAQTSSAYVLCYARKEDLHWTFSENVEEIELPYQLLSVFEKRGIREKPKSLLLNVVDVTYFDLRTLTLQCDLGQKFWISTDETLLGMYERIQTLMQISPISLWTIGKSVVKLIPRTDEFLVTTLCSEDIFVADTIPESDDDVIVFYFTYKGRKIELLGHYIVRRKDKVCDVTAIVLSEIKEGDSIAFKLWYDGNGLIEIDSNSDVSFEDLYPLNGIVLVIDIETREQHVEEGIDDNDEITLIDYLPAESTMSWRAQDYFRCIQCQYSFKLLIEGQLRWRKIYWPMLLSDFTEMKEALCQCFPCLNGAQANLQFFGKEACPLDVYDIQSVFKDQKIVVVNNINERLCLRVVVSLDGFNIFKRTIYTCSVNESAGDLIEFYKSKYECLAQKELRLILLKEFKVLNIEDKLHLVTGSLRLEVCNENERDIMIVYGRLQGFLGTPAHKPFFIQKCGTRDEVVEIVSAKINVPHDMMDACIVCIEKDRTKCLVWYPENWCTRLKEHSFGDFVPADIVERLIDSDDGITEVTYGEGYVGSDSDSEGDIILISSESDSPFIHDKWFDEDSSDSDFQDSPMLRDYETFPSLKTPRVRPMRTAIQQPSTISDFEIALYDTLKTRTISTEITFDNDQEDSEEDIPEVELSSLHQRTYESASDALAAYSSIQRFGPYLSQKSADVHGISFRCGRPSCCGELVVSRVDNVFRIERAVGHSCIRKGNTTKQRLDQVIAEFGEQKRLTRDFIAKVRETLKDDVITVSRIRRSHNRVFKRTRKDRIESWGYLPGLCEAIEEDGGTCHLDVVDGKVQFCAIMPSFLHTFVESDLFSGVISIDGSFQCGISRGQLLGSVTVTGARKLLPLNWGWGETEDALNCGDVLRLFREEGRRRVLTVISDESGGILSAVKEVFGQEHIALCARHKADHIKKQESLDFFWYMLSSRNEGVYQFRKRQFKDAFPIEFRDIQGSLKYYSRFEMSIPRDNMNTNGLSESFNALCAPWKNMEPYFLFKRIYEYARMTIIELRNENPQQKYTGAASSYIYQAVQIAGRLHLEERLFKRLLVYKDDVGCLYQVDVSSKSCSCLYTRDCGLPCPHLIAGCRLLSVSWEDMIHPRYMVSCILTVFPRIPEPIDFTAIEMFSTGIVPMTTYSLKTRKKRVKGIGDYREKGKRKQKRGSKDKQKKKKDTKKKGKGKQKKDTPKTRRKK